MPKSERFLDVCRKCGSLCCKLRGPHLSGKERERILRAGFSDNFIMVGKDLYRVKAENNVCPYLKDDGSCTIQEVKPIECSFWPVVPGQEYGKLKIAMCPLYPYLSKKDIEEAKKEASTISAEHAKAMCNLPASVRKRIRGMKFVDI
jgi:Fe-S-cluster containining protein